MSGLCTFLLLHVFVNPALLFNYFFDIILHSWTKYPAVMKIEEPLPSSSDDHNLVKCCRRNTSYMAGSETEKLESVVTMLIAKRLGMIMAIILAKIAFCQ